MKTDKQKLFEAFEKVCGIKIIKEENLNNTSLNEEKYDDFFYFLEDDPKLNTFAYLYYVSNLNRYLSKPKTNPMIDKFIKISKYKFRFGDTYEKAVLRNNPDYEFKKRSGEYTKVQGFSVLEFDAKGDEVLPIMPLATKSHIIVLDENNKKKEVLSTNELKEKYSEYFIGSFISGGYEPSSGVDFRALKVKNIVKINAGGNTWINKFIDYSDIGIDNANIDVK